MADLGYLNMFAPTQKPRVIAAAVVIVSPLCAGRAIGELGHDRADVPSQL